MKTTVGGGAWAVAGMAALTTKRRIAKQEIAK